MPISLNEAYQKVAGFDLNKRKPNPMQAEMFARITSGDCATLLKAPTGSGKTEAVLVPALAGLLNREHARRLFLILPTRSLVDDQIQRVEKILERLSQEINRELAMVVDTGGQTYRRVWKNGKAGKRQPRHLYDGDVILTTLDKFLYRFFSFGEPFKNYIFPLRIHYGAKKPLFCFDEAHTYEDVAFTNFVNLVHTLAIEKGNDVVVMTATMPEEYARHLHFLDGIDFISGDNGNKLNEFYSRPYETKILEYIPADESELVAKLVKQAKQQYQNGQRMIVTVELVKDAAEVYEQLRQEYGKDVLLYHGRIPDFVDKHLDKGRTRIYKELKRRDDDNQGYLLVTTSAIEVGCDLNAHTLITELCNPDQLIQRAGRCNRKGDIPHARVTVVGNKIKSFLSDLDEEQELAYIETLKALHGKPLDKEAALVHLHVTPQMDYRVQKMFEMLYEYVYEADQVYKSVHEKGMVITRSWEPSLTICTGFNENNRPLNPVSVNIRSLVVGSGGEEQIAPDCVLYRHYYEGDESHRYKLTQITGGWYCAYLLDLYLQVPESYFDEDTGYKDLPKVFKRQYGGAYRERVTFESQTNALAVGQVQPKKKGKSSKKQNESKSENKKPSFWYLRELDIPQESQKVEEGMDEE